MIVNQWLDWAIHFPGPADKVYSQPNSGEGIACHSVVGAEKDYEDGIPNRFLSLERTADGRYTPAAAASCMFILRRNGVLIQMYPVTASTWTSGGFEGNTKYWAIEAEGGLYPTYGEPLTLPAQETFIRLVTEWEAYTGLSAKPGVNILQHSQIAQKYNYAPTACASGRYAEVWERIASGERYDDMTPAEVEAIVRKVFDESSSSYYRALTRAYWDREAPGAYSAPPDPEVVAAIHAHKHSPKGGAGRPL
jgi:hypothetical protein